MSINYLLIVEGEKAEPKILLEVLKRYGFNVIRGSRQSSDGGIEFAFDELSDSKRNVVIAQAARNRLEELFNLIKNNQSFDFNLAFRISGTDDSLYSGVFLIFDVDHTSKETLKQLMDRFNNESDGMLLVSSPCIEVMSDPGRKEELHIANHISEYKKIRNLSLPSGAINYIIDHFEEMAVKFLDQNTEDFNETNIMEHPRLVVEQINTKNDRFDDGSDIYRYFTTVVYVAVAYMEGLTRQIQNYKAVRDFFASKKGSVYTDLK